MYIRIHIPSQTLRLFGDDGACLPDVFSIQDPCTARHDSAWLAAVRSLAQRAGARVEEPRLTGASTACCGYGGLVWCAQPQTAKAMSDHRAAQLDHPGLASCIMCRDRMAASGKECWHLLDLLLPASGKAQSGAAQGPGLSARRANRAALRRKLLRHTLGAWLQEKQFSGDFDVQRRAEEVPVDEYVALAQTLAP